MTHSNNDFIKRFLGEQTVSPEQQKALLKKQRMENYYKSLEQKNTLVEENKKAIDYTTRKIFSNTKTKTLVDLQEAKKSAAQWIEKLTPYGLFFYNKEQDVWMNNFGVIKKTLDELIQMISSGYEIVSGDSSEVTTMQSFFSDSGSKLALFNSSEETVSVYDISYTPTVSTTLLNTVNVGVIPFSASSNEKGFVSDDGNYLILTSPNSKSVYFFDVNENALLQTVTEDQPLFGSLIAVDKDFYGIAISSTSLNRDPSVYDTRLSSLGASSKVSYYERNYDSSATPCFKRIHSHNAYGIMRKTGMERANALQFIQGSASDQFVDTGVFRSSDLVCKGYNFAIATLGLATDQINYKSFSYNYDSPRYLPLSTYTDLSGLTQGNAQMRLQYVNGPAASPAIPTDAQSASLLQILNLPSVKQFSIVRNISGNYYKDKSYYMPGCQAPILTYRNYAYNDLKNQYGITYFNQNIVGTFAEKTFIRGNGQVTTDLVPVIEEEVLNTKVGINDTHTYHVSQIITQKSTNNIKNIRIYRFSNTNAAGTSTFHYQDYSRPTLVSGVTADPSLRVNGLVKILYKTADASTLENSFFTQSSLTSTQKTQLGQVATKTYLSDPLGYSTSSEFAYPINESGIIDGTIQNIFASNDHIFINFESKTLVFKILATGANIQRPLIYQTILSTSLCTYNFTYSSNISYFSKENKIYKYNDSTLSIDLIATIG